jgi:dTDP-4-amino-4,6-dideoxygalactose transaminase
MGALKTIADRQGLKIIEDACQAIGATYRGKPAGSFGLGCFSLYATKNIMSGEGGMITTDDDDIAEKCRVLRNHGMRRRYYHDELGFNFRMSDLHAAIGISQLGRLADFTARRRSNAAFLNSQIQTVITPSTPEGYEHVWHQYTIRVDGKRDRDEVVRCLNAAGVGTGVFYPIPIHQQVYMRGLVGNLRLPVVEKLANQVISLPVHPQLIQADLDLIAAEVNKL